VRKFLNKVLLAVNLLFAFALLLSYMAVHISPEKFALPAFFGLAYPYILLINVILVITWAVLSRYEALISVFVIALGLNHLSNYIKIGKPAGDKKGTLKVMSYNVRLFNYFEKNTNSSENKILAFIKAQKPDIICLQEFYLDGNAIQKNKAIIDGLGGKYLYHMKVLGSGNNRNYGIVTYSRFPIVRKGEVIHPGSSSLTIYSDIVIGKDTIRIFNNHLQSFRLKRMDRSFLDELTSPDEKETLGEMKNLSVRLKKGFVIRAQQAEAVKDMVNRSPYPVIVAGDFNDTPVSYSYRKIRNGLNDAFVTSGYGAGFTYKGNYPANRIDFILYNNFFISRYFEIFKIRYSDHYPIAAYFSITPKKEAS
jgi:endonuclease/exonuclease/phosphatase family metal-dependent hydrolase